MLITRVESEAEGMSKLTRIQHRRVVELAVWSGGVGRQEKAGQGW